MHIRQSRGFLGLVTTLFCTVAFSSAGTSQAGDPAWFDVIGGSESVIQQPLLLAKDDTVFVCHVFKNGNFKTEEKKEKTAQKLIDENPNEWLAGRCEDNPSFS